jgi:hypothetical protein
MTPWRVTGLGGRWPESPAGRPPRSRRRIARRMDTRMVAIRSPGGDKTCLRVFRARPDEIEVELPSPCRVSRLPGSLLQALARGDKPPANEWSPDQPLGQPPGRRTRPNETVGYRPESLMPRQISHTRSPASRNPPSSMDQSPALNSRKRRSPAISIFVNMICSALVNVWCRWIGINVTPVVSLPQRCDRGCDPNATAANFVRWLIRPGNADYLMR